LKRLHSNDPKVFQREADVLKRFSHIPNNHLIKLLATIEITSSKTYYLIFPWAEGDLQQFWKSKPNPAGETDFLLWMSDQCHGLADALGIIHHDQEAENLSVSPEEAKIYGRHGDIKPSNILRVANKSQMFGQLVLNDFGLANYHRGVSRSGVDPKDVKRSPTYRPPEFDTQNSKLSRKFDIWTLGCTFLEFITWYLRGWDGVESTFPNLRAETDADNVESDIFFRLSSDGKTAEVKPQVLEWINDLHGSEYCTPYLHDFLDLIQGGMLKVNVDERYPCNTIIDKLLYLKQRCIDRTRYYSQPLPRRGHICS
jgi:serine/threonine protein kinase